MPKWNMGDDSIPDGPPGERDALRSALQCVAEILQKVTRSGQWPAFQVDGHGSMTIGQALDRADAALAMGAGSETPP